MKRAVIVGGGIVGLSCAYELVKRGHPVTVCDDHFGVGCSYGNGGIIVPSHFTPLASPGMLRNGLKLLLNRRSPFGFAEIPDLEVLSWIAKFFVASLRPVPEARKLLKDLNLESRKLYQEWISELNLEVGFETRGLLIVCATSHALQEEQETAEIGRGLGLEINECSPQQLGVLEPEMPVRAAGALHYLDDAHLSPSEFMKAFADRLAGFGVKFLKCEVKFPIIESGEILSLSTNVGEVEGDCFVFAAGARSGALIRQVGISMPLLSGRGYGLSAPANGRLVHPSILVEARVAATPLLGGIRFVGVMELGHATARPNTSRLNGMLDALPDYFPTLSSEELRKLPSWSGNRPCSPDGIPYIGPLGTVKNAFAATGHAMMGMSLGPVTGKLVGKMVDQEPTRLSDSLLSPNRYA